MCVCVCVWCCVVCVVGGQFICLFHLYGGCANHGNCSFVHLSELVELSEKQHAVFLHEMEFHRLQELDRAGKDGVPRQESRWHDPPTFLRWREDGGYDLGGSPPKVINPRPAAQKALTKRRK